MNRRMTLALALAWAAGAAVAEQGAPVVRAKSEGDAPVGVLLAVGDIARCGESKERRGDEAVADIAARQIQQAQADGLPVRLVLLGDLAYPGGTPQQYADCFDPAWGRFKNLMLPVSGNHDFKGRDAATPFLDYFRDAPLDAQGQPLITAENKGNYAIRFPDPATGPWLLVGIDTGRQGRPSDLEALRRELDANRGPDGVRCILAFSHHFRFSSGLHGHGEDESDPAAALEAGGGMEEAFDLLDEAGASVLLSGHDHDFEQFGPQDTLGRADPAGLRSFIVGTGGGDPTLSEMQFQFEHQAANQEYLDGGHYGLLRIELFPDHYSWSFLRTDGTEVEPDPHEAECQPR